MVRAILREIEQPGTGKTMTRRVLTTPCEEPPAFVQEGIITALDDRGRPYRWPKTKTVGDRLYVREHWRCEARYDGIPPRDMRAGIPIYYVADPDPRDSEPGCAGRFRQGMFMPRWASRITLIVTDVRVQRLQEISEADAIAEGVYEWEPRDKDGMRHFGLPELGASFPTAVRGFRDLWDSINGKGSGRAWADNPWVAAYTFHPILANIDELVPEIDLNKMREG